MQNNNAKEIKLNSSENLLKDYSFNADIKNNNSSSKISEIK